MKHVKKFEAKIPSQIVSNKPQTISEEKKFTLSEIMAMLPTEKEAEVYTNGYFGYAEDYESSQRIHYSEQAFISGCVWTREIIERRLKGEI